ncbi:hypothetical protein GOBAR_AA35558 [Gossypium barbadense]|uniref:Uncharacterized protein n=1 Tax=Gossypium barbadense TaxID=3634 RepID=A0A2P5W228_GOSBA|nr:hypothetical protein GOBAR_AA35558 [Gossypium barbadense]
MEDLMKLFETESYKAWAALELEEEKQVKGAEITMQQAEDYFDSVIETAVDEFRRFEEEMEREAKAELSGVDDTAEKVKKIGDLMEKGANIASKLYVEAAMKSAEEMGLLSIIQKIKRKEKEMRILMVLDNSGKTTIVLKINGEDTSVISPTLGFNIKTITYQKYTLNIWDVGGQRTIRSYWRNYFEQTDGLVWVVDSSDLRRLDDCKMELDTLLKEERLSRASLLILANKQDIKGALTQAEIAKILKVWQRIQSLQAGKAKA